MKINVLFFSELAGSKSQNQRPMQAWCLNIKHQIKLNRGHERRNQEKGCCVSLFCKYNIV